MTASTALQLYSFDGDLILTERKFALSKLSVNKKHAVDANFITTPKEQIKNDDLLSITPDNNRTLLDLQIKGADVNIKREIKTYIKNRADLKLRPEFNPPHQLGLVNIYIYVCKYMYIYTHIYIHIYIW
jgi:hypothetical protein